MPRRRKAFGSPSREALKLNETLAFALIATIFIGGPVLIYFALYLLTALVSLCVSILLLPLKLLLLPLELLGGQGESADSGTGAQYQIYLRKSGGGHLKVGKTRNPRKRDRDYITEDPGSTIIDCFYCFTQESMNDWERRLIQELEPYRLLDNSREWFHGDHERTVRSVFGRAGPRRPAPSMALRPESELAAWEKASVATTPLEFTLVLCFFGGLLSVAEWLVAAGIAFGRQVFATAWWTVEVVTRNRRVTAFLGQFPGWFRYTFWVIVSFLVGLVLLVVLDVLRRFIYGIW